MLIGPVKAAAKNHIPTILEYAASFGEEMLRKPAGSATFLLNEHNDTIGASPRTDRGATLSTHGMNKLSQNELVKK
jgi:hypothetical protein